MSFSILFSACPVRSGEHGVPQKMNNQYPCVSLHWHKADHHETRIRAPSHVPTTSSKTVSLSMHKASVLSNLTCHWYSSSQVRVLRGSSFDESRLRGNAVLGRRRVCANALLSTATLRDFSAEHEAAVLERYRQCFVERRVHSEAQPLIEPRQGLKTSLIGTLLDVPVVEDPRVLDGGEGG